MDTPLFEKYVNLIRKRAHEYSAKYGVEYSEVESQGFLIYCECLQKYDFTKSKFTTYLYIQLNRLGDYVKTYKRQQGVLIQDHFSNNDDFENEKDFEETLPAKEVPVQLEELLLEAEQELSKEAFELLCWIVRREWEAKNKRTPTISMAVKYFNNTKRVIEKAWEECRIFWYNKGSAIYA